MERFNRFVKLIDEDKFNNLQNIKVLIVGVGGVGGHALESLLRSGILNITIVDYDKIDITNINRQIISLSNNIGENKVLEAKKRALLINPNVNINALSIKLDSNNVNEIISDFDYVIDACDDVCAKKEIIKCCIKKRIKFISCMGMGNKFNPELIKITEIRKTSYDKLAKILRKWVIDNNINEKIMVVSSTEEVVNLDGFIGSVSYVPSVAGILCASYVINDFLKKQY